MDFGRFGIFSTIEGDGWCDGWRWPPAKIFNEFWVSQNSIKGLKRAERVRGEEREKIEKKEKKVFIGFENNTILAYEF